MHTGAHISCINGCWCLEQEFTFCVHAGVWGVGALDTRRCTLEFILYELKDHFVPVERDVLWLKNKTSSFSNGLCVQTCEDTTIFEVLLRWDLLDKLDGPIGWIKGGLSSLCLFGQILKQQLNVKEIFDSVQTIQSDN